MILRSVGPARTDPAGPGPGSLGRKPGAIPRHAPRPRAVIGGGALVQADRKNLELVRRFTEQYAKNTDTRLCVDKSVAAVVIQGLAAHKQTLGAPLCPCRHYEDPQAEAKQGYWNCPCVPMRERRDCHCMLFLEPGSSFAGEDQTISPEEVDAVALEMRGG